MSALKQKTLVMLLLCISLLFGGGVAYAATTESDWWDTGLIFGVNYTQCADLQTTDSGSTPWAYAKTWVRPTNTVAPVGYEGARAYLCYTSGAVYSSSPWMYNNTPAYAGAWMAQTHLVFVPKYSSWISWGATQHWNGYGYYQYNTWQTRALTVN